MHLDGAIDALEALQEASEPPLHLITRTARPQLEIEETPPPESLCPPAPTTTPAVAERRRCSRNALLVVAVLVLLALLGGAVGTFVACEHTRACWWNWWL